MVSKSAEAFRPKAFRAEGSCIKLTNPSNPHKWGGGYPFPTLPRWLGSQSCWLPAGSWGLMLDIFGGFWALVAFLHKSPLVAFTAWTTHKRKARELPLAQLLAIPRIFYARCRLEPVVRARKFYLF